MDRLFQYNRFGQVEEGAEKDDTAIKQDTNSPRNSSKFKKLNPKTTSHRSNKYKTLTTCPAYAELYAEYGQQSLEATTGKSPEAGPVTTSTFIASSTTAKSVELAIRKYQEWSTKFLTATSTTKTTTSTATEGNRQSTASSTASSSASALASSSSSSSSSTAATLTSSGSSSGSSSSSSSCGYHSQHQSSDTELLVTTAAQRRPKVYDCMKDFLKRKLFHQPAEECTKHSEEEDVTSDYDEVDMLDSSYNADEEYETDSSSDSCSSCPNTDESNDEPEIEGPSPLPTTASMLNCWTKTGQSAVTTPSSTSDEDDSDAGISDCCQLLSERSPKRRGASAQKRQQQQKHHEKKKTKTSFMSKQRFNITEEEELLETTWYQPHLSNKAAAARLAYEAPGAFLLYRRTRHFELALRLQQSKVRNFVVLCCGESYKFKGAKKQFSSLKALVTHHSVMAEHLPLTLTLPRPETPQQNPQQQQQQKLSLRCADDFDTFESLQILGILKRLQAEDWDFS